MSYQNEIYAKCPGFDCGVEVGQQHTYDCDIARCKEHGFQRIWCDECGAPADTITTFKGVFPGTSEAIALGMFAIRAAKGKGIESCTPDTPGAMPDLNTLYMKLAAGELTWNSDLETIE